MPSRHSIARTTNRSIGPVTSGVTRSMTPAQRTALQQLLFESNTESHTLGEAIDRYRTEHLYVDGLSSNTIAWREAAIVRLDRWRGRDVEVAMAVVAKKIGGMQ